MNKQLAEFYMDHNGDFCPECGSQNIESSHGEFSSDKFLA
jgi:rRNA maturation endonuclease Nob1